MLVYTHTLHLPLCCCIGLHFLLYLHTLSLFLFIMSISHSLSFTIFLYLSPSFSLSLSVSFVSVQTSNLVNITLTAQKAWGCDNDVFSFRCSYQHSLTHHVTYSTVANITFLESNILLTCSPPSLTNGLNNSYAVELQYIFKENENANGRSGECLI